MSKISKFFKQREPVLLTFLFLCLKQSSNQHRCWDVCLKRGGETNGFQGTGLTRAVYSPKDSPLSFFPALHLGKENGGKSIRSNARRVALTVSKRSLHRHKIPVGLKGGEDCPLSLMRKCGRDQSYPGSGPEIESALGSLAANGFCPSHSPFCPRQHIFRTTHKTHPCQSSLGEEVSPLGHAVFTNYLKITVI